MKKTPIETIYREKIAESLEEIGVKIATDNGPLTDENGFNIFPQGRLTPGAFTVNDFKGAFLRMTHEYELTVVTDLLDESSGTQWENSLEDSTIAALEQLKNDIIRALYRTNPSLAGQPNSLQIEVLGGTVYPRESGSNFAGLIFNISFKTSTQ